MIPVIAPDERTFREHLAEGAFRLGEVDRLWRCVGITWPIALIAITAAPRPGSPNEFMFRFDVSEYPAAAPTARLWDLVSDAPLPVRAWPQGGDRIRKVFRPDWQNGSCLYLPCDRISMAGHSDWPCRYPREWWTASCEITHYLRIVHELLTSAAYTGGTS